MITETQTKSANYLRIIGVLRSLLAQGKITDGEYQHAKNYYQRLTGADIIIIN
jgi:hypothetical protein